MTHCPHANIVYCPLYHASHGAGGGCDDGRLGEGGCAVDRGLKYAQAVARLNPAYTAKLKFHEDAEIADAQRRRNMKAMGVH